MCIGVYGCVCLCSTGTSGTATQKRDCKECAAAKWCPGGPDSVENDCPDNSVSFLGSYEAKQCTCKMGWFGVAHYHATRSCKMCLADTYCPGGQSQYACPQYSSSSDEESYCSCDASYYGITHDDCTLCDKDHFCPGGDPRGRQQYKCPPNSLSPAGSDSGNDCQCAARFYEPVPDDDTEGPDCILCPSNTYCIGGPKFVPPLPHTNKPVPRPTIQCASVVIKEWRRPATDVLVCTEQHGGLSGPRPFARR